MSKFQVGDKVVRISADGDKSLSSPRIPMAQVVTVREVDTAYGSTIIRIEGYDVGLYSGRFRPATQEEIIASTPKAKSPSLLKTRNQKTYQVNQQVLDMFPGETKTCYTVVDIGGSMVSTWSTYSKAKLAAKELSSKVTNHRRPGQIGRTAGAYRVLKTVTIIKHEVV